MVLLQGYELDWETGWEPVNDEEDNIGQTKAFEGWTLSDKPDWFTGEQTLGQNPLFSYPRVVLV